MNLTNLRSFLSTNNFVYSFFYEHIFCDLIILENLNFVEFRFEKLPENTFKSLVQLISQLFNNLFKGTDDKQFHGLESLEYLTLFNFQIEKIPLNTCDGLIKLKMLNIILKAMVHVFVSFRNAEP